jgi:hypothetical protein
MAYAIELTKLLFYKLMILLLDEPRDPLRYQKYHLAGKFFTRNYIGVVVVRMMNVLDNVTKNH